MEPIILISSIIGAGILAANRKQIAAEFGMAPNSAVPVTPNQGITQQTIIQNQEIAAAQGKAPTPAYVPRDPQTGEPIVEAGSNDILGQDNTSSYVRPTQTVVKPVAPTPVYTKPIATTPVYQPNSTASGIKNVNYNKQTKKILYQRD